MHENESNWTERGKAFQPPLPRLDTLLECVIYIYFRDESESEEEVTEPFPTTPSSQVEHHISVRRDAGSPDTVILDDDDDAPVVNEKSILKVVSCSQSFYGSDLPALLGKKSSLLRQ